MIWLMEILKICIEEQLLKTLLHNKALNITKNPKYVSYQRGLASTVYKCFDKKSVGFGLNNEHMLN